MKALVVLTCGGLLAATALVYGRADISAAMGPSFEPAALLLSGSVLLGAAGALRRYTF